MGIWDSLAFDKVCAILVNPSVVQLLTLLVVFEIMTVSRVYS